jgi:hypothetical protein
MRLTWPSTEYDRIISYTIFLNSILKSIAEQKRAFKNVYGNVTNDPFSKSTDVLNFLLRLSKVKHQRQLTVDRRRPYGPLLSTARSCVS